MIAFSPGTGYQLCDNSIGVLFNDLTRLIMYNDGDSLQYIERNDSESYLSVRSYPSALTKKVSPHSSVLLSSVCKSCDLLSGVQNHALE